jgi:flagellar hook-basal body complex protein FliE
MVGALDTLGLARAAESEAPLAMPATERSRRFPNALGTLLRETDQAQREAEAQARALAEGEGDVVETMVALSKAELSLRLVTAVRDRVLDAYQEVMRMQV